jgi:hypothetical protein
MAIVSKLITETYIDHQDCLNAEEWRKNTSQHGFPPFTPVLQERNDPNAVHMKCDACGTVIRHAVRQRNIGVDIC